MCAYVKEIKVDPLLGSILMSEREDCIYGVKVIFEIACKAMVMTNVMVNRKAKMKIS